MAQIGLAEVETIRAVHDANRGGRPLGSPHEHLSATRPARGQTLRIPHVRHEKFQF